MTSQESMAPLIIAGAELRELLSSRKIVIDPILEQKQVQSVSVDLRLDSLFGEFKSTREAFIDPAKTEPNYLDIIELEFYKERYVIQPGDLALGQTFEYLALPNDVVGQLEGRSSIGRQGLMVHVTAGIVDPGFSGHLVFELANVGKMPIYVYPLMRVARMMFIRTKTTDPYLGQYSIQVRMRLPSIDADLKKIRSRMERLPSPLPAHAKQANTVG